MAPFFYRFHALAVDDPPTRFRVAPPTHSIICPQRIIDKHPQPTVDPPPKVPVHRLPFGILMRQQPPGTAAAQDVQNRVYHVSNGDTPGPPAGLGCRKKMLDPLPGFIVQIARIGSSLSHLSLPLGFLSFSPRILLRAITLFKHPLALN